MSVLTIRLRHGRGDVYTISTVKIRQLKKEREDLAGRIENQTKLLQAMDQVIAFLESKPSHPNGHSDAAQTSVASLPDLEIEALDLANASGLPSAPPPKFSAIVRKAIGALSGGFTKSDVSKKIHELFPNVVFSEQDVSSLVWRMANRLGELRTVKTGRGGHPSLYAKPESGVIDIP